MHYKDVELSNLHNYSFIALFSQHGFARGRIKNLKNLVHLP